MQLPVSSRYGVTSIASAALAMALLACGGSTESSGGDTDIDGGTTDAASRDSGGTTPDGGPLSTSCPTSLAAATGSCQGAIVCEYGDDPDLRCDSTATCASGTWAVTTPGPSDECSSTNSPACPATFAGLMAEAHVCSPDGISCDYLQARCTCSSHCGMVGFVAPDGGPMSEWCCPDAPQQGCPSPRPRLGSTCTTQGQSCDYGGCNGNVIIECDDGVWTQSTMFGCPG